MPSSWSSKRRKNERSEESPQPSSSPSSDDLSHLRHSAAEPLHLQMRSQPHPYQQRSTQTTNMDSAQPSLLSSSKISESQLQVQLHPLVILIISDHITRHTLRQQSGPIVGAIIGAQNGRDVTMEFAFECKVVENKNGDTVLDDEWFQDRLQQYKDVHKSPALDLIAWFALAPTSGPQPHHLPIHQQLVERYNESTLFLAFHPDSVADGTSGSKLPITIYESGYEASSGDGDKHMQSSDEAGPQLVMRFKELPYTVETGEAEMISVDFVARGGTNATVTNGTAASSSTGGKADTKGKGKGKANGGNDETEPNLDILSQADEELISSLTAKANAIRMLRQRISLIKAYLTSIPPCYLNTLPSPTEPVQVSPHPQISYTVLRTISATLARLPLLTPSTTEPSTTQTPSTDPTTFTHQAAQQRSDVALVSLLGSLGTTIRSAQDMGRKASIMERDRFTEQAMRFPSFGSGGGGGKPGKSAYGMDDKQRMDDSLGPDRDEGYVDDYIDEEDDDLVDGGRGGGVGGGGGGGVSLAWQGTRKKFADDEEMT